MKKRLTKTEFRNLVFGKKNKLPRDSKPRIKPKINRQSTSK